jgi:hypothetical protein
VGAWGPGLFSDDTACDVRDEYKDLVGDGLDGPAATDRLLADCAGLLEDPEESGVFWLALAATQWRLGRLEERVRAAALQVIESERDLLRWDDPKHRSSRKRHLAKLRQTLDSPQPKPRRVAKPFRDSCDWLIGEIVAYTLTSGDRVLFRVLDFFESKGGRSPIVEVLDWQGLVIPTAAEIQALDPRRHIVTAEVNCLILGAVSARERPVNRIERPGVVAGFVSGAKQMYVVLWRQLDQRLAEDFGFR